MLKLLVLLGLLSCSLSISLRRTQSAAVRGRLVCDGQPAANVKVKLWDDDRGDSDDLMAQGRTDSNGEFFLSGYEEELTSIDPKLAIYHDCNDGVRPCQRKFSIMLPDSYISSGKNPTKTYDAGTIQLAGEFLGESRDCLN